MRHYFYKRMDNPGGGDLLYQWKTTHDLKNPRAQPDEKRHRTRSHDSSLGAAARPKCTASSTTAATSARRAIEGRPRDGGGTGVSGVNTWVQPKVRR